MMASKLSFLLVALFFEGIACEVVVLTPCNIAGAGAVQPCTIHEVRINPCKENPDSCVIRKGKSASISFDFTPNFAATELQSMVYWESIVDLPFAGMDSEACKFTSCPTEAGKRQTFEYNLAISKILPSGTYPIKWMVWNEDDPKQTCCFKSSIKLKAK